MVWNADRCFSDGCSDADGRKRTAVRDAYDGAADALLSVGVSGAFVDVLRGALRQLEPSKGVVYGCDILRRVSVGNLCESHALESVSRASETLREVSFRQSDFQIIWDSDNF